MAYGLKACSCHPLKYVHFTCFDFILVKIYFEIWKTISCKSENAFSPKSVKGDIGIPNTKWMHCFSSSPLSAMQLNPLG